MHCCLPRSLVKTSNEWRNEHTAKLKTLPINRERLFFIYKALDGWWKVLMRHHESDYKWVHQSLINLVWGPYGFLTKPKWGYLGLTNPVDVPTHFADDCIRSAGGWKNKQSVPFYSQTPLCLGGWLRASFELKWQFNCKSMKCQTRIGNNNVNPPYLIDWLR